MRVQLMIRMAFGGRGHNQMNQDFRIHWLSVTLHVATASVT